MEANPKTDKLIDQLVADLRPKRFLPPLQRAGVGFVIAILFNTLAILAVQSFRPHFLDQMLAHPRFMIELATALVLIPLMIYFFFVGLVPGRQLSSTQKGVMVTTIVLFIASLVLSFQSHSPETTFAGARAHCLREILVYGLLTLSLFGYFILQSHYALSRAHYFAIGFAAPFVPGVLMQISCIYEPYHALTVHYGPSLIIGALSAIIFPLIKGRSY